MEVPLYLVTNLFVILNDAVKIPFRQGGIAEFTAYCDFRFSVLLFLFVEIVVAGRDVQLLLQRQFVADMFKFRSAVGMDLAVSALKQCLKENRFSVDELMRHARINRVANVILPYIEGAFA